MNGKKLNDHEMLVDCGEVKEIILTHPLAEDETEEESLNPADYDRWDGRTCIKFE
jgi:hypothetical protein